MLKEFFVGITMKKIKNNFFLTLLLSILLAAFLLNNAFSAEMEKFDKNAEIHVSADLLVSDRNAGYAEFTGSVVATRDGSILTCNKLKVFYSEKSKEKEGEKPGAIDKMIATESVKLTFENKIAVAEKAVYTAADDSMVLTGGDPKVTSGNSYVSGKKIILFRTTGKVVVESGKTKRVNAEFHPQDKEFIQKKPE